MRHRLASLVLVLLVAGCGNAPLGPRRDAGRADAKDAKVVDAGNDAPDGGDTADARDVGVDAAAKDGGDAPEIAMARDASDASDGPTCDAACEGTCVAGACLDTIAIVRDVNLSRNPIFEGRTCAAAPQYAVTGLTATIATLAETVVGDCLEAGDEVMLIDMQGTPTDFDEVGTWELLQVASVSGTSVTFTTSKLGDYDAISHKIMLARVPRFDAIRVLSGTAVMAAPWNGTTGGLLVLRAAWLRIDGDVYAGNVGYRGGRWCQESQSCASNLATEAGESISGPGGATTLGNVGGSGGIAEASGIAFLNNTPISPSPAHATAGQLGANPNGRTLGQPGAPYGVADGTRLTMGSGPGGSITCGSATSVPRLIADPAKHAGGIVALFVDTLVVGPEGVITASPPQARDVSYAGGYVYIRGGNMDLRTARVRAKGSTAMSGSPPTANLVNKAGDGYVVLDATGTITGTTDPAAFVVPH